MKWTKPGIKKMKFSRIKLLSVIFACGLTVLSAQAFEVAFNSAETIGARGGILSDNPKFIEGGLECRDSGTIVNFCKFPSDGIINPAHGTIEITFKPFWKNTASKNCLFNTGVGVMWGEANTMHLQREGDALNFIIIDEKQAINVVSAQNFVSKFDDGKFHQVTASWDTEKGLALYVDGVKEGFTDCRFTMSKISPWIYIGNNNIYSGGQIYYYPSNAVIKSMRITDAPVSN